MKVAIVPVGTVDQSSLYGIWKGLSEVLHRVDVYPVKEGITLPNDSFNPSRGQYLSSRILPVIRLLGVSENVDKILGVTEADIYASGLNFIFGEAEIRGQAAIISLHRLKPEFYGELPNSNLFLSRAIKEAVHEIGHTLGLMHCLDPRCVMFFSNSIIETDRKDIKFCKKCSTKIF